MRFRLLLRSTLVSGHKTTRLRWRKSLNLYPEKNLNMPGNTRRPDTALYPRISGNFRSSTKLLRVDSLLHPSARSKSRKGQKAKHLQNVLLDLVGEFIKPRNEITGDSYVSAERALPRRPLD